MAEHLESWLPQRRLRVCVWNATPAMASSDVHAVELELKKLGSIQLVQLKTLDDPGLMPCDLLVILGRHVDEEHFTVWLQKVESRLSQQGGIKIPAVIYAHVSTAVQRELLRWAVDCNWYFDIVDPDHLSGLPIRVANFLRLHDHLHEVKRMQDTVGKLTEQVETLEKMVRASLSPAITDDTP